MSRYYPLYPGPIDESDPGFSRYIPIFVEGDNGLDLKGTGEI